MKKSLTVLFFTSMVSMCFSQSDTLILNNEKVPCTVKEITADAVKYTYPQEELINTVYKNSVQKIIFKSGRVQTFNESSSFKKVANVDECDNVTITSVESEVKGLFKVGDVSSKAKGTTTLSNQERVKERAYRKLKIEAAMMGANIVYLTDQRTQGNRYGGYYQSGTSAETSLTGVAYSNQVPEYNEFMKLINSRTDFQTVTEYKMWSSDSDVYKTSSNKNFKIIKIVNDNGIISIEARLQGESKYTKFKLAGFDKDFFYIYYQDKSTAYNYKIAL